MPSEGEPLSFRFRRVTDLLLPPQEDEPCRAFQISDSGREWLLADFQDSMRTGCVKAWSESKKSRSGMLLYRGRAVGCIYSSQTWWEPEPTTERSLQMMLADMELPDTKVQVYDVPEPLILAMSALFLGYPVERTNMIDVGPYFDNTTDWLRETQLTACAAFTIPAIMGICLGFFHEGSFLGAFYVEEQTFSKDLKFVHNLISHDPNTQVEVSILPPEMTSNSVPLGFSLSTDESSP